MSQDLLGRILINYSYYGNELTNEQAAAYNKKWPEEKIFSGVKERLFPNGIWYKVKSHDPVVIVSNDSGNSFRLALTEDFTAGIKKVSHAKKVEDNSVGMPMVEIPSGEFIMGSLSGAYDEKPLRPVYFKNKILMGKYPVRVKETNARGVNRDSSKPKMIRLCWLLLMMPRLFANGCRRKKMLFTVCLLKPSGNMLVVPVRFRITVLEMIQRYCRATPGIKPTLSVLSPSGCFCRIPGGCTI
jgi:hypothetical protein